MYTESSVELKSDFYSRYGTASGVLYFERVGLPFALLKGEDSVLGFAASCGVRAYGRRCGDVIKVLDSESNVCDVRFGGSGTLDKFRRKPNRKEKMHGFDESLELELPPLSVSYFVPVKSRTVPTAKKRASAGKTAKKEKK